jgi:hypothetical protein
MSTGRRGGGCLGCIIASVAVGDSDSQRPGCHFSPIRNYMLLQVDEAKEGGAGEEELLERKVEKKALFSIRMVGKSRFFEKARIAAPLLVCRKWILKYFTERVQPRKPLNHLELRLLKALQVQATLLEMVILAVLEYEFGFPCIVAKVVIPNAWDWDVMWDAVQARLQKWRLDPTTLLDGGDPCVFGEVVKRAGMKYIKVVRALFPPEHPCRGTLVFLASGACERLEVCMTRFAKDQLASERGPNRREVVGAAHVASLPVLNPTDDGMEGACGMGKQFKRHRQNAGDENASGAVAFMGSQMAYRMLFESAGDKRKGHHVSMEEGRKLRKEQTKDKVLVRHGRIQAERAEAEAAWFNEGTRRGGRRKDGSLRSCHGVSQLPTCRACMPGRLHSRVRGTGGNGMLIS